MADDVMRMQREAARRVQRMQEHSRQVLEGRGGESPAPGWPGTAAPLRSPGLYTHRPSAEAALTAPPPEETSPAPVAVTLPRLEAEQWLLLGLALLLFRSGCSMELLLALLYLAM